MEHLQKRSLIGHAIMVVVILFALVLIFNNQSGLGGGDAVPDSNLYQVALLANDQVYYGKLHAVNSNYPYLTDVYYLKQQQPQVDKNGRQVGGDKFTVIKRGIDEIHAPSDKLYIARDKIVYWENVGINSLVAKGIKADKDWRAEQAKKPAQTQPVKTQEPAK